MNAALEGMQHSKVVWLSHDFMFARLAIAPARADVRRLAAHPRRSRPGPPRRARRGDRWATGAVRSVEPGLRRQRPGRPQDQYGRIRHYAPIYAVVYAIVFTLVAFDGIMALQPHWFSNLLGGFYFMGSFLGAHMLLGLMMIYGASHLGVNDLVSPKQRHDLGKLCFGFTVFWTYLMWAQFLVIWYGNMPEETGFVFSRLWGRWLPIGATVLLGMFIIPFFGLLGVAPKKVRPVFGFFATISLVALWLERYLLVMPSVTALPGPVIGSPEIGSDAAVPRALSALLRAVRADLPDDLAATRGDHAEPRAGPRARSRPSSSTRRDRRTTWRRSWWSGGRSRGR